MVLIAGHALQWFADLANRFPIHLYDGYLDCILIDKASHLGDRSRFLNLTPIFLINMKHDRDNPTILTSCNGHTDYSCLLDRSHVTCRSTTLIRSRRLSSALTFNWNNAQTNKRTTLIVNLAFHMSISKR